MFSPFIDFKSELGDFVVDPKLKFMLRKSEQERMEFLNRFPLEQLTLLSPDECWSLQGDGDDFVNWIINRTRSVTNPLPWAKVNMGLVNENSRGNYYRRFPIGKNQSNAEKQKALKWLISESLVPFIVSRGRIRYDELESFFGKRVLLKLLYLYHPNTFANIAKVGWIDGITNAFALDYGDSVFQRSIGIRHLFNEGLGDAYCPGCDLLKDFFVEYLGLEHRTDQYKAFLLKKVGLSSESAERYAYALRQISRLLVGFGITKKPLFSFDVADLRYIKRNSTDMLLHSVEHDVRRKISRKKDLFGQSIDRYLDFIESEEWASEESHHGQRVWYSIAGVKQKPRHTGDLNTDTVRRIIITDWEFEFKRAKTPEDVVSILEKSGMARPYCRHYTNLTAFLSICEKGMFRLTRGDDPGMNDQLEWKRLGDVGWWKRTFISSFSCVEGESAAMWGLYGKPTNEALRLSFDAKAIAKWIDQLRHPDERSKPVVQFVAANGDDPVTAELQWEDITIYFADILYGGKVAPDGELTSPYRFRRQEMKKGIFSRISPNFEKTPAMTGFIKSSEWAYEEETRLVVRVNEDVVLPIGRKLSDIQYVFVPISREVLEQVEYMKGPGVTPKLRPIFAKKISEIFPSADQSDSIYRDNLKFK